MKRLYTEHREVEEARDRDTVVATFDDDCFLENVLSYKSATGREAVRKPYEALFTTFPDLSPTSAGEAYSDDVFVTWGTVGATMSRGQFCLAAESSTRDFMFPSARRCEAIE
jgi:hypothetical protein